MRVLVTGVSNFWGRALAARLGADPGVEAVVGLDDRVPEGREGTVETVAADLRDAGIGRVIRAADPDVVVHNDIQQFPSPDRGARTLHDVNVVGTLGLLAACEGAPRLRAIVVRGSAAIYGSEPAAPAFFREADARRYPLRTRFQRDIGELEALVGDFSRRRPAVACCVLRLQPAIGTGLDSPITRLLRVAAVPTFMGFDPRVQFLHEDDSVEAMLAAVRKPVRGAVNVAGPGAVTLGRALRMLGKRPVPIAGPLFGPVTAFARRAGARFELTEDMVRFLRHGRAVDVTRLVEELGYTPRFTTEQALRAVAAGAGRAA